MTPFTYRLAYVKNLSELLIIIGESGIDNLELIIDEIVKMR